MSTVEPEWLTLERSPFDVTAMFAVWLVAAATYGVGDVVTTIAIVWSMPLYAEANPLVLFAIERFGGGGFLALKLLVFYTTLGISLWAGLPERDSLLFYGPPALLAIVGLVTTARNLSLILA